MHFYVDTVEKQILNSQDQLTIEWAGTYRHYHSAMFRTIPIGKADPKHYKMHEACIGGLNNCENKLKPGNQIGTFDVHAKTFDDLGYKIPRTNACGYSLGATFSPNWMDWPMLYTGNPYVIKPGNIFTFPNALQQYELVNPNFLKSLHHILKEL